MATQELTIWTYPDNNRVWKAQIAGEYNGIKIVTPPVVMGVTNKTPEFLAKFPMGKVPAMETPFGNLFESGAIARYVARLRADTGLLGTNFFQASQIDQWIDWNSFELETARGSWLAPIWGYRPYVQSVYEEAKKNVLNCLNVLNNHLKTRTYMVGNQVTLADIVIVTTLQGLMSNVITEKQRDAVPELMRWYTTCLNQPQFSTVMKEKAFALAKEEAVYTPKDESKGETKAAPVEDKPAPKAEQGGKKNKNKQSKKEEDKPKEAEKPMEAEKAKEETPKKGKGGDKGNKQESGKKAEERPKTAEAKETPKKTEEKPKETPKKEGDAKPKQESGKKEGGQQQQGSNKKKSKGGK